MAFKVNDGKTTKMTEEDKVKLLKDVELQSTEAISKVVNEMIAEAGINIDCIDDRLSAAFDRNKDVFEEASKAATMELVTNTDSASLTVKQKKAKLLSSIKKTIVPIARDIVGTVIAEYKEDKAAKEPADNTESVSSEDTEESSDDKLSEEIEEAMETIAPMFEAIAEQIQAENAKASKASEKAESASSASSASNGSNNNDDSWGWGAWALAAVAVAGAGYIGYKVMSDSDSDVTLVDLGGNTAYGN